MDDSVLDTDAPKAPPLPFAPKALAEAADGALTSEWARDNALSLSRLMSAREASGD